MSPSHTLFVTTAMDAVKEISLTSPAFKHKCPIPAKYTTDGANINPPLIFDKIPDQTQSLVLLMEDPNAPVDTWVHWLVWNIDPSTRFVKENSLPGTEGLNAFRLHRYHGPCIAPETRYFFFKVFALDTRLELGQSSTKYEVMRAMKDHVIGYGELVGTYKQNNFISAPDYSQSTVSSIYY